VSAAEHFSTPKAELKRQRFLARWVGFWPFVGCSCFYNPIKVSDNLINGRRQLKNRESCTRAKRCQKATTADRTKAQLGGWWVLDKVG